MKHFISIILIFSSIASLAQAVGCSSTTSVAGTPGQAGLFGEYFAGYFADNTSFFSSGISSTNRIESNLNYTSNNWGAIVPPATNTISDPNNYSSRYRGSIYIATTGTYTFYLTSDDASYLWIDNDALSYPTVVTNALINNGGLHGDITVSNSITLSAGFHNIQIQFGEQNGGNHLIFEYSCTSPTISRQVVPNSILCTGVQAAISAPVVPAPSGCNCSAGVISEFYAGYFNNVQTFFTSGSPSITRLDPKIGFTTDGGWGNVCPPLSGTNASPETYSTRFTGSIYVPTAGTYTFYLTSDDASFMWIDANSLVTNPTTASAFINNGGLHSATTVSNSIYLNAGLHDFKIHFGENTGNNICYLEYENTLAGISRQTIPQTSYCSCTSQRNLLPIELLDFNAQESSHQTVTINWQTASELNNKHFEIERSSDSKTFVSIGLISSLAVNGNSNHTLSYSFEDTHPLEGTSYYRLKQVDKDGTTKYFGITELKKELSTMIEFTLYPNPTNTDNINLTLNEIKEISTIEISILSFDGQVVYKEQLDPKTIANSQLTKHLNLNLNKGIYMIVCSTGKENHTTKLVIQ